MTWDKVFENYWANEDEWNNGLIQHLKNNYHPPIKKTDGFVINKNKWTIEHNGVEKRLQKKTFMILEYLFDNKGTVLQKNKILSKVWGDDVIVLDSTINVHIRHIRKTFKNIPIVTKKGVGYGWL